MNDIANRMRLGQGASTVLPSAQHAPVTGPAQDIGLRVTLDDLGHPAYMLNHNFELVWINGAAQQALFGGAIELPSHSEDRSLFRLLPVSGREWASLLRFHVALAKSRLSPERFSQACRGIDPVEYARIQAVFTETAAEPVRPMLEAPVTLPDGAGAEVPHRAYASFFREGMFTVLMPDSQPANAILELLARRDEVIRGLLRRRLPVLTHLAVLVADLQSSVKICSELPPEEYFELINEIWTAMAPIFRKHDATCGKHVGDGMVYYFFPQPDSDYLANAVACALEIRQEMHKLSKAWQLRKHWLNELYLNTGINEGQEWFGTYPSSTGVEFVVLGDTINQAARISDLARHGGIWATKSLIGKLTAEERDRVVYGVRRRSPEGHDVFVASSFSQVSTLIEQDGVRMEKLRDIATLAITEIVKLKAA
jgi:adenylate cyclase